MNCVYLSGNLVAKPETKETAHGKFFCDARIAVYRNADATDFIDLRAWEKAAERLCLAEKGERIVLSGRLCVDEYETQQNERRKRAYVTVQTVEFFRAHDAKQDENERMARNGLSPVITVDELPF